MNTYTIKKANGAPDWKAIPEISIDNPYLTTPDDISAKAQICYNDEEFLVHLSTVEKNVRATENGPIGVPCEDSCLEFFFCPMENDSRYFNIEFNMNACVYLGFGSNVQNLVRLIPEEPTEEMFAPKINKTEELKKPVQTLKAGCEIMALCMWRLVEMPLRLMLLPNRTKTQA